MVCYNLLDIDYVVVINDVVYVLDVFIVVENNLCCFNLDLNKLKLNLNKARFAA